MVCEFLLLCGLTFRVWGCEVGGLLGFSCLLGVAGFVGVFGGAMWCGVVVVFRLRRCRFGFLGFANLMYCGWGGIGYCGWGTRGLWWVLAVLVL